MSKNTKIIAIVGGILIIAAAIYGGKTILTVYTGGTKGKRYALPNATIHIHQPWGGVQGQAVDIEIEARRILRERERLNKILAKHTGQSLERIIQDTDRNYWMNAEEAVEYGIVDEVLTKPEASEK